MATRGKKFKVTDAVGQMDVDLRCPGNEDGFHGLLPEPSQQQVSAWQTGMSKMAEEFGFKGDMNDAEAISEYLAEMEPDDFDRQAERMAELHADLFGQEPSTEQVLSMPPRYRQAFYGYVAGEFTPESSAPAGKS